MKASDLLLRCLEEEGVDVIFGVPGEENADLMNSLHDSPIQFVTTRHEQGAAFMADLYGRLTGKAGVCLSTLGPGATNALTGVANANMDNSPLVIIAGQAATTRLHKESHQAMDIVAMFKPTTKWAHSIYTANNVPEVVRKAFKIAQFEKPGACLIEFPENIAKMDTNVLPFRRGLKVRRPGPDFTAIDQAMELINKAEKPILLVGNGCVRTRAAKQLNLFVERTGIHVAHTFMGKGVVSDRNNRSLGAAGLQMSDHVTEAVKAADLVICIGYDMVEWHPFIWNPSKDKQIINIDFEPAEVDEHFRTDVEIIGDVAGALWQMNELVCPDSCKEVPEFVEARKRIFTDLDLDTDSDVFPMKPQRIIRDLRKILADDDILISDVGAHKMWIARYYETYVPNTCIISNGFCSMGIAVPGAISAKRLLPDKRVLGVVGDGGFLMNVQELATAVQYKIPAVFLIWEDAEYGLITWKQMIEFKRQSNTRIDNPDFVKLAESFGCRGFEVKSAADFIPTMEAAFAETTMPSVVTVKVDYSENLKLTERLGQLVGHK